MLLRDVLDEVSIPCFAHLCSQMDGALGHQLQAVMRAHPGAMIDLQVERIACEVFVELTVVEGERVACEHTVALGVSSSLTQRAQVTLLIWELTQSARARAIWREGIDRKLMALGLTPLFGDR